MWTRDQPGKKEVKEITPAMMTCPHLRISKSGPNAQIYQEKSMRCGYLLTKEWKTSGKARGGT